MTNRVFNNQDVSKTFNSAMQLGSHSCIKAFLVFLRSFLSYFRNYSSFPRLCSLVSLVACSFFSVVCLPSIFFLIFCNRFLISSFLYYSVFLYFFLSFLLFLSCLALLFPLDLYNFLSFSCLPLLSMSPCRFHPSLSALFSLYFITSFFSFSITYAHVRDLDTLYVPYDGHSLIAKSYFGLFSFSSPDSCSFEHVTRTVAVFHVC